MFKFVVKKIFASIGYTIVKNHPGFVLEWTPGHENKIDLLEALIRLELREGDFRFLQLGANDGVQADPLSALIRKYKLKGSMFEPIPEMFGKLRNNYDDVKDNIDFHNMAISVEG